eukprot:5418652-Amphidinium_carterae.1
MVLQIALFEGDGTRTHLSFFWGGGMLLVLACGATFVPLNWSASTSSLMIVHAPRQSWYTGTKFDYEEQPCQKMIALSF